MLTTDLLDCYDVLHALCEIMHLRSYLEIGVREGASICCVLAQEKEIINLVKNTIVEGAAQLSDDIIARVGEAFTSREVDEIILFDNWSYPNGQGGHDRIVKLLEKGFNKTRYKLIDGDSQKTVPRFFEDFKQKIDLVFVDGDHSAEGAIADLENVAGHFKILVFHDLYNPGHLYLADVWRTYTRKHNYPSFIVGQNMLGVGVAFNFD